MPNRPQPGFLLNIGLILLALSTLTACAVSSPIQIKAPRQVVVTGLVDELRDNVIATLDPPSPLQDNAQKSLRQLQQLARQAPSKVRLALQPYGYYTPTVETRIAENTLYLTIEAGTAVRVTRLSLSLGEDPDPQLAKLLAGFTLAEGDILRHDIYEDGKATIVQRAQDLGFLDARFATHRVTVDAARHSAEIDLTLASGPQYLVGAARFTGAEDYPDYFLRRYLTLSRGEPLTYAELGASQQQLRDSDRFSRVVLKPRFDETGPDQEVPIDITLTPEARRQLRPGIGYGTDTGGRISLRYLDLNAFEQGHEFQVDGLLAERKRSLSTQYLLPGRHIKTTTALRAGYEGEYLESYETRYAYTEVEQIWGLGKQRIASIYTRYQREDSDIGEESIKSRYLLAGLRYRQGKIDNPTRPRQGYGLTLELRGTNEDLLSDVSLTQVLAGLNILAPLGGPLLLHVRASGATTIQENEFDEIPASLRFFTGGDRTVRGYAYQSLGPRDADGNVTGGKHRVDGSLELEWRFLENWGCAGFYDTGNAFNSTSEMNLAEAVGGGIRYYSIVGPVWIDLARTVNVPDPDYRAHFGIGFSW